MIYEQTFLTRLETGLRTLLADWDLSPEARITLLTISENATFRVTDGSLDLVVRVNRPGYHTEQEVRSELAWIEALRRDRIVETPPLIRGRDGEAIRMFPDGTTLRHAIAFGHMSGVEPDSDQDLVYWYRHLGEITARLHRHACSWRRPSWFTRKTWNFDRIIGQGAYWGDWRDAPGLTPAGHGILGRAFDRLKAETEAYGYGADRFGLVHCDLRAANLLVEGDRLGVIDFDDCGFCWFAYDFAASVSFIEHEPFLPDLLGAWLSGYRRVMPLPEAQEAAIPMLILLRRMQLTAWIASHAETPTAQSLGPDFTAGTVTLAERYLRG